jgi:hypothetical protein
MPCSNPQQCNRYPYRFIANQYIEKNNQNCIAQNNLSHNSPSLTKESYKDNGKLRSPLKTGLRTAIVFKMVWKTATALEKSS